MSVQINAPRDPNTLSNYIAWRTTHTTVNFDISFERKQLTGNVVLQLKSTSLAESKEIILDSNHVDVKEVKVGGVSTKKWTLLSPLEPYGTALKIQLDKAYEKDAVVDVDISVATTDECTALQWLTPTQTSNKKHPYMFSQCEAIHARSIFPCQDTPDVKSTFDFNITSPLPVIASGIRVESKDVSAQGGSSPLQRFQQKVPIPSYLFALASGDIVQAPVGPRSFVASGPDEIEDCQWELERDIENFIRVAEKVVYDYAWSQFNVLILPGSFPYGGMENPVFTFATPTIISKDRENVDLIAHELAHSWSGNLVSNASWEHFWLNEGWTVYLERRIIAGVHGEPHRDFSSIIGWKALIDSVDRFGKDHEFTKLIVDLKGKDPDDAYSSVPYEKGFHFLYYLEKLLSKPKFDKFIPYYFTKWKGQSLDSYDFKATILEFFESDTEASKLLEDLDWDTWFYKPGLPPKPDFDTSLVDVVNSLADKWETLTELHHGKAAFQPSPSDIEGLVGNQLVVFLERVLLFDAPLTSSASQLMGKTYNLSKSENAELTSRYCQVGLRAGDPEILEPTRHILKTVGRMKYVRPLYRRLKANDRQLAREIFEENKDFYHPICRMVVEKDLSSQIDANTRYHAKSPGE